jgi:hypothetical protein
MQIASNTVSAIPRVSLEFKLVKMLVSGSSRIPDTKMNSSLIT